MADYQYITPLGVILPDTADIRASVEAEWREALGADIDLSPDTPQGVLVTAEVEARDAVVRNNAEVANQINPDLAGGVWLDAIWALTRGQRRPATRSQLAGVQLAGTPGTIIPGGSRAAVQGSGDLFETTATVILDSGGTAIVAMQSVEFGPVAAPAGQLVQIATSVLGWETVNNPSSAALGSLQESDIAARRRRRQTLALQGVALPEAITSRLYAVEGVRSVAFRENVTSDPATIDGILIGPHSIYACVQGGTDADVAQALLETKSLGAGWTGTTTVSLVEPFSGQTYAVAFQRPTSVTVSVRVTARFNGVDAQNIIPLALQQYADGDLEGQDGFIIGSDVTTFEISGAINQVEPRIFVTNVELSTDGINYASATVPIALDQIAALGAVQVTPA